MVERTTKESGVWKRMIFVCVVCGYKAKGISPLELGFISTLKRGKYVCDDCAKEIAHNLIDDRCWV